MTSEWNARLNITSYFRTGYNLNISNYYRSTVNINIRTRSCCMHSLKWLYFWFVFIIIMTYFNQLMIVYNLISIFKCLMAIRIFANMRNEHTCIYHYNYYTYLPFSTNGFRSILFEIALFQNGIISYLHFGARSRYLGQRLLFLPEYNESAPKSSYCEQILWRLGRKDWMGITST